MTEEVREAFHLRSETKRSRLGALGFSPAIEDRLAAIGRELYRDGIVDNRELYAEQKNGVLVRDTTTGREQRQRNAPGALEYGSEVKSEVATRLGEGALHPSERAEVAAFLAAALRPDLTRKRSRPRSAAGGVDGGPRVFTKIPRGKSSFRKGDEITRERRSGWPRSAAFGFGPVSWVKVAGICPSDPGRDRVLAGRAAIRPAAARASPETIYASMASAGSSSR